MNISLFDFDLPRELIAQFPARRRSGSRLLVLERKTGQVQHRKFPELLEFLNPGDGLVVNNTKVFKARLFAHRKSGGNIEIFLVRRVSPSPTGDQWEALVSPSRRLREGEEICFDDRQHVTLVRHLDNGRWIIDFGSQLAREKIIAKFGHVPLPPYISREDGSIDSERYQTVFASPHHRGAVAAPTAGLHFTEELLAQIRSAGVKIIEVTLHVGPGTFKPIKVDDIDKHLVDPEYAEISAEAATSVNEVKRRGGKIVAVGTTSVRTLEAAPRQGGRILPFTGPVDLYIKPGYRFHVVDRMVTNFHLPKSSLLVLVSALAGREAILEAYREAIEKRYRFYSYGDAMLIL
jgi:S-adenosylmethionine:tRNA ribosyltransferase-isomerase